ncbi:MAG: D-glycero-beta-D-manno-heptose-7-phosphate kinase [Alphaproteobacteria bacterium]|nr:D-glycero-beta-D-manno-heptose-7-phosphate kinase [Alphaproteobacteria bacterium]
MSASSTNLSSLAAVAQNLQGAAVLCVGDVMLDRYVHGDVDRISPEAPIPVLRVTRESAMLGGAGNVAANIAALGGAGRFVSVVGGDGAGNEVVGLLDKLDGISAGLVTDLGRKTTLKTRFVGAGQQLVRADVEDLHPLGPDAERAVLNAIDLSDGSRTCVVLSDYGKGVLSPAVIGAAIERAHAAGVQVVVDPKGRDYARYRDADLITPNKKELAQATGMAVDGDAAVVAACEKLIAECGVRAVLATRSAEGMTLVSRDAGPLHLKARAREVFDVSGAGDTVVATLALALAAGADMDDAARLANAAAGVVVGKAGTATVSTTELISALHHQDLDLAEDKLVDWEQARRLTASWRDQGLEVGFTNGCFDLLHPGHISLLTQARAACDLLVVGLNSDASVKRLKGETRPVQSEAARAAVLGALSAVDLVVLFSEDTPLELIETLRPAVLVKGADYTVETVVGADVVMGYGGRVALAALVDGHSTTNTIKRINRD